MAAAIDAVPTGIELRLIWIDEAGEPAPQTISIDDADDTDIETFLEDLASCSNALLSAKVVYVFGVTGITSVGKPAAALQSLVAAILAMEFQKANPLNALKTVTKQVALPAYLNALRNDAVKPHIPVTTDAALNGVIGFLGDHLMYTGVDGEPYGGGWTFNWASKFGTKPTVTDGF